MSARSERLPTLRGASDDDINQFVDAAFATAGEPLKAVSLFYALYWLVGIEGVQAAAFDFKQVRERQSRGFWWYGTFTMASEFANGCGRYFIVGENLDRKSGGEIREHAEEFLFPDDPVMAARAADFMLRACRLQEFSVQRNLAGYENTFGFLRDRLEAELPPDVTRRGGAVGGPWTELARDMFLAMPTTNTSPDLVRRNDETGWSANFNGPAWVGIGNHLLRRDDLSDTAFVDQSWALEHNNRTWIDKIDMTVEGPDEAAVRAVLPALEGAPVDPQNVLGAVIEVLDATQEGDMETVFTAAVEYDHEVEGVNLRRLARERGVLEL